ncbi:propanediol dehydratase [Pediococcus claussenii]|nr:glycerol dehydratase reactivase beta/small subunit family protein [Pediococcus claussenii]ANZ70499.1 propanediol dehydratase [Pediococcus claussenii]ANZ72314.1 propanediol dehydratase [Pediococcus claussenii]
MNNDKPSIIVAIEDENQAIDRLQSLFNGIEEEEIPVTTMVLKFNDVKQRAYQAALASRLSVGIGFEGSEIVVHYKNLHEEEPLFDILNANASQQRILGANAARLVKGTPFKELKQ